MQVKVDQEKCIGCGTCAATAPEVFEMIDVGGEIKASVKADADLEKNRNLIEDAIDGCAPVAISIIEGGKSVDGVASNEMEDEAVEEIAPAGESASEEGSAEEAA